VPSSSPADAAQALANRAHAQALVSALVEAGVRHAVCSPGSRSTPLVLAADAHPNLDLTVHFDERGAAFFALGIGRATGAPAVWITTSGTAVANGMPAAVEADADAVPLVLLTADRPPELRQTGANQTIEQPGFFARIARLSADLPTPHADLDRRAWATAAAQAVYRAQFPHAGPVHLNAPFRKPLWPEPNAPAPPDPPVAPRHAFAHAGAPTAELAHRLAGAKRGLIVAGRLASAAQADAALALGAHLNWPVLPDLVSQARLGTEGALAHHDLALASPAFAQSHQPDALVLVGGLPVSGRLLRMLEQADPTLWASIRPGPDRIDPHHRATHVLTGDVETTLRALIDHTPPHADEGWRQSWADAAAQAWSRVEPMLAEPDLSEPAVAYRLSRLLPQGEPLVVAASMPVRDLQTFASAEGARAPVYANRGASGIDGTVATAAGVARGSRSGATLLVGDLALLHDLNSLALLGSLSQRIVVVCVNNDGGGIFGQLPIAAHAEPDASGPFERLFGTPHGLTFAPSADQFGLAYDAPATAPEFETAYRAALARSTSTLIEVRTNRRDPARARLLEAAGLGAAP
jgi:2-succinyl-5-enolpyruvyl-6-hydroxy-3-cyclohexene-1-carboxylate synthase